MFVGHLCEFFTVDSNDDARHVRLKVRSAHQQGQSEGCPRQRFIQVELVFLHVEVVTVRRHTSNVGVLIHSSLRRRRSTPLVRRVLSIDRRVNVQLGPIGILPNGRRHITGLRLLSQDVEGHLLMAICRILKCRVIFFTPRQGMVGHIIIYCTWLINDEREVD